MLLAPVIGAIDVLNPESLIDTFGVGGLVFIVFAECGLLVGFFLPGDSLLFTGGLLVSQNVIHIDLPVLLLLLYLAAVGGDQVGYLFGHRVGPALFRRPDSRIFKQRYVEQSRQFFERHGPKTVIMARFVPIVRTFAPVLAGVGRMRYRTYLTFDLVGGLLWAVGVTTLGYFLGETVPSIDRYLLPAIVVIVGLSVLPAALEVLRHRRQAVIELTEESTSAP